MTFDNDYLKSGEIFADENIFCMRCSISVTKLAYKEMPKINDPSKTVNVVYKKKLGNYRQMPVVLKMRGNESISFLILCQDCIKETIPEENSIKIINQLVRAMKEEAEWSGLPYESLVGIEKSFYGAKIIRKLTDQEIIENKILQETI